MKYFLQTFSFTFLMYFGLWVMWVHFAIDLGKDDAYPGSLFYLPHAARVICTCLFGWYAIPAIVCAEMAGINFFVHGDNAFLVQGVYSLPEFAMSLFSASTVLLTLILLRISGMSFNYVHGNLLLKKSNARHIFLIVVISAFINGVFGNFLRQAFTNHDIHMWSVLRFTVGDILGCLIAMAVMTIMYSAYKDIALLVDKKE